MGTDEEAVQSANTLQVVGNSWTTQDVKLPIAASLHEISRIIGSELSKEYMFAALDTILKDHSDTLKLSAISHLSEFVELFDKATQ